MTDDKTNNQAQKSGSSLGSKILQYKDQDIAPDTQAMLNKPIEHPEELDIDDKKFLTMLMEKIDKGEIDLYRPSTLLNFSVYDKLDEKAKGKADFDALNLLGTIREIRKLWNTGERNSYQMENLTHRIRVTKERLEEIGGDIYII